MRIYLFFLMALSLVLPPALADQSAGLGLTARAGAEGNYTIKDFHFADGETLPQLRIHYRTLGKPVSSSGRIQNAVLILHGTSSTGDAFLAEGFRSAMFGAGQPLDVSKYYLILPDSMLGNPRSFEHEAGSLEETREFLDSAAASIRSNKLDANDLIYRLEASADYDPAPDLRKVRAAVLSINFADDEINPPELGFIARAKEAVPNGEFVLIPASNETAGHQTLARAAVYEKDVADFLAKARFANSR